MNRPFPLHITFRNIPPSEMVEEWVRAEVAKLEKLFGQIMSCRVVVEMPHLHHSKGSHFRVGIELALPGGQIAVNREPNLGPRARRLGAAELTKQSEVDVAHKNLRLAIDHAFRAAGRRLQDYARLRRRAVKTHEPRRVARVSKLIPEEGFGFLVTPEGREIYFHGHSVLNQGFDRLKIGTAVHFDEEQGEKGLQASTVRIIGKQGLRRRARERRVAS